MENYFKRKLSPRDQQSGETSSQRQHVEINLEDLPSDPGKRIKISEYHPNDRERIRRAYLQKGPCQPTQHKFPQKKIGNSTRRFNPSWFNEFSNWLEYSIEKDAAFCLCCYLFKPDIGKQSGGDTFVVILCKHGLTTSRIRGQGNDGASNMRGELNAHKSLILRDNSSAFYVHCFAHQLQLTLVALSTNTFELPLFLTVSSLINVVGGSCKRLDMLRERQFMNVMEALEKGEIPSGQGLKKLVELAKFYPHEFSPTQLEFLENELGSYIIDMRRNVEFASLKGIGDLSEKLVENGRYIVYPRVYLLLKLAMILPVATATVERAFSAMKIVKTRLRNQMGDEWMNDSLVTYIEKEVFMNVDIELIIQQFQNMKSRRGQL